MTSLRRGQRPQAEGAIHMHPRPGCVCPIADFTGRVERAGIDVAGLGADQRQRVHRRQGVGPHASLPIDWHTHNPIATEADHHQRLQHTHMHLLTHDHTYLRRTDRPSASTSQPAFFSR